MFEGASWSEAMQSAGLSPAGEARLVLSPLGSDSALVGNVGVLDIWCFSLAALYTFKASFLPSPPWGCWGCAVPACLPRGHLSALSQPLFVI